MIRDAARATLERLDPQLSVMVFGNTDTVGTYRYNDDLSERRAAVVKTELERDGLDPRMIGAVGHAFDDPRVETGPGVAEEQNRRAVILIRSTGES